MLEIGHCWMVFSILSLECCYCWKSCCGGSLHVFVVREMKEVGLELMVLTSLHECFWAASPC